MGPVGCRSRQRRRRDGLRVGRSTSFALATDGTKVALAWSEHTGSAGSGSQIYLREYSGGSWQALGGSASGGGLSNTAGASRQPSVAYLAGEVYAAWQAENAGHDEVYAARFNGAAWVPAGTGAAGGGGVSQAAGECSWPRLAAAGGRLHLLWVEDRLANQTGNSRVLYAKRWDGAQFVADLPEDAGQQGIAGPVEPQGVALAVDPAGQPFVAWTDVMSGNPEVYLRGQPLRRRPGVLRQRRLDRGRQLDHGGRLGGTGVRRPQSRQADAQHPGRAGRL